MRRAFFSLGSNVGDRADFLRLGVETVATSDAWRISRVYVTEPVGGVAQEEFWNLVLEVTTDATARELFERIRRAEELAERTREVRWGPRTLDVDLLMIEGEHVNDPDLVVPHPRMRERRFVLEPLSELAPEYVDHDDLAGAVGLVEVLGTLGSLQ